MKKYILLFLLFFFSNANSEQIIAYIDIDKILKNSTVGKNALKEIEGKIINENKKFTTIEKQIKKEETDLNTKKNVYSKDEFEKKFSLLKSKVNKYNSDKKKSLDGINKLKVDYTNKILSKILLYLFQKLSMWLIMIKSCLTKYKYFSCIYTSFV